MYLKREIDECHYQRDGKSGERIHRFHAWEIVEVTVSVYFGEEKT